MHSNTHGKHQDKFFPALSDAYQRTKELLQQNKESIQKVAERLLKKEVIFKEDLESILGKRPDEKMSSGETQKKIIHAACK